MSILFCTRCGTTDLDLGVVTDDYAYCESCDRAFHAAMAAEFPFGQCQTCGVAYWEATCEQGRKHIDANHVEGACGSWNDAEPLPASAIALGYCSWDCKPDPRVLAEAELEYRRAQAERWDAQLRTPAPRVDVTDVDYELPF